MQTMIRLAALGVALLASPAAADNLSPWMGSDDQTPFQLDPTTMVAVTFAADPLQTGSISKSEGSSAAQAPCLAEGCTVAPKPARNGIAAGGGSP